MIKSGRIIFQKINESKQDSQAQQVSNKNTDEQKLNNAIQETTQVLAKAEAVFPFDLSPDAITVDKSKVNIIEKEFLGGEGVRSILLDEISDVIVETASSLATIKIVEAHNKEISTVNKLKYKDANRVRNVIQGLIVAKKNNINLDNIDPEKLPEKLEKLGQGAF